MDGGGGKYIMAVALIFNYLLCAVHRILMYLGIRDRLTNLASVKTDEQIVLLSVNQY